MVLLLCAVVFGQVESPGGSRLMQLSADHRAWYRNPDGSCVQCSIGMAGAWGGDMRAATLLWDSPYGSRERGGSGPGRVAAYLDRRRIRGWNVTGASTWRWMAWAVRTGRYCAIGAGGSHFQTLVGYDAERREWLVCNNNSTGKIDRYDDAAFRRLHLASGQWCVVLDCPSPDYPVVRAWWGD
jgi:hypothetical protein